MSNNQLPADVQEKALTYSLKGSWVNYPHPHPGKMFYPGTGQSEVYSRYLDGYIAGATNEAERVQKLVDALEKIKGICEHEDYGSNADNCPVCIADEALQQWKDRKEVRDGK